MTESGEGFGTVMRSWRGGGGAGFWRWGGCWVICRSIGSEKRRIFFSTGLVGTVFCNSSNLSRLPQRRLLTFLHLLLTHFCPLGQCSCLFLAHSRVFNGRNGFHQLCLESEQKNSPKCCKGKLAEHFSSSSQSAFVLQLRWQIEFFLLHFSLWSQSVSE